MVQRAKRKRAVVFRDLQGIGYGFIHNIPNISLIHALDTIPRFKNKNVAPIENPAITHSWSDLPAAQTTDEIIPKLTNSGVIRSAAKITTWPPVLSQTSL
tara:strand:- start:332 stop:631 length:300 start_codon:yes stop_codon:yes gene_type:complete